MQPEYAEDRREIGDALPDPHSIDVVAALGSGITSDARRVISAAILPEAKACPELPDDQ